MGWENVFHCECNAFGKQVLTHYWPNAISYDDITTTDFSIHHGNIDILTGDSLANPSASPENDWVRRMLDISGQKCLEQFERLPRATSWVKTFMALLIGMEGWYSKQCKLTWKLKGTKYHRLYCQLVPSTLPTEGIGSGLWPTVVSSDATTGAIIGKNDHYVITKTGMPRKINQNGADGGVGLARLGKFGLLPTPTTFNTREDWTLEQINKRQQEVKEATNRKGKHQTGNGFGLNLAQAARMLPTPTARIWKGTGKNERIRAGKIQKDTLDRVLEPGNNGRLNPHFVAEMMGFPPNWTALPFQHGDRHPS